MLRRTPMPCAVVLFLVVAALTAPGLAVAADRSLDRLLAAGQESREGVLYDVLNFLKPQFDPDVKNDKLRFYVSATATDDYQAIVAWGEFDPTFENKAILLAVTQDGESLAVEGLRLVVPDDIRGGRYVSLVETIRLDRARQPTCPKHHFWWLIRHPATC